MSFLPHDSLRLAAALLVRASAGSALTALMLLVLVSAGGGAAMVDPATPPQTAAAGGDVRTAERGEERQTIGLRGAESEAAAPAPYRRLEVTGGSIADGTLPQTRGP
ncbi:MAG: hypothetical protein R3F56_15255 [Planctomycetota bacterium]